MGKFQYWNVPDPDAVGEKPNPPKDTLQVGIFDGVTVASKILIVLGI